MRERAAPDSPFTVAAASPAPLLRVPPFPGAKAQALALPGSGLAKADPEELLALVRSQRVGGAYWAAQPALPAAPYLLVRAPDLRTLSKLCSDLPAGAIIGWIASADERPSLGRDDAVVVSGDCDPWHLMSGASAVLADENDELALLASIAGVTVLGFSATDLRQRAASAICAFGYVSPFSGEPIAPAEAIALCGFWRTLIDSNRKLTGAVGFAFWKRPTVAPLLWSGAGDVPFLSTAAGESERSCIAVWRSRTPQRLLAELESKGARLVEVEDGFIRSSGLGADCVAPLSIVVDTLGIHFDPSRPSELEQIIQAGGFSPELIERARQLRSAIVAAGLGKYGAGRASAPVSTAGKRLILVPGQVEDDRAVQDGGSGLAGNLDLLRRVRSAAPDARILYKPHPDVEAGHRRGAIADELCLTVADEIVRDEPISSLLHRVDEVHVNTSLAGFEALLREKSVTTYGVPFYAGWGLTTDLAPVPPRRSATRTLDELVASALLLYPRYLDPLSGLPCPPEILVRRLCDPQAASTGKGIVVRLRQLQGRWSRRVRSVRALVSK